MKLLTLLVLTLTLVCIGCIVRTPQPIVQPVLEQSTTGTTQYDYKAGPPNEPSSTPPRSETSSPANSTQTVYHSLDYYFPGSSGSVGGGISWGGNWGFNFSPTPVTRHYFWTGTATVTVAP